MDPVGTRSAKLGEWQAQQAPRPNRRPPNRRRPPSPVAPPARRRTARRPRSTAAWPAAGPGDEREILLELADAEERHAAHWATLLGDDVGPPQRGDIRMRVLAWLARHFGSVFVLALAQRAETRSPYDTDLDATRAMAADERVHEEVVRGLAARGRARVSGTFRAAVFGANDGLVSNLALVLGVSGGGVSSQAVLLTGLAGLLAGALSMGAGEYVSVRSQRELLAASAPGPDRAHRRPAAGRRCQRTRPGLPGPRDAAGRGRTARRGSAAHYPEPARSPRRPPTQDHDVVGTGIGAALSSFCFFATGAAIPVLPFLFGLTGTAALVVACVLVGPRPAAHRRHRRRAVRRPAAAPWAAATRDRPGRRRGDLPASACCSAHRSVNRAPVSAPASCVDCPGTRRCHRAQSRAVAH